jgi:flagellin
MKDLATQGASDLLTASQRDAIESQFTELQSQLDNAVNSATIFGQNLTGANAANVAIQSGINSGDTFTLTSVKSDAVTLGVDGGTIDLSDAAKASASMTAIDQAIATVAQAQSTIGTQQTGLEALQEVAEVTDENLKAGISRIEDADIAQLSSEMYSLQTKQQMQIQMLGMINQMPSYLLQLLR